MISGYSYWVGGIYPGISWRWANSGHEVVKDINYWSYSHADPSKGYHPPSPTDLSKGRCLVFQHVDKINTNSFQNSYGKGTYSFQPGQCGFEKHFICQELAKSHRRNSLA